MMEDIREISTKFEAKKIGMRHTKDGHVFYMACHPDDTPADLMQDPLGQRYMFVAVRLDDNDQPVDTPKNEEGRRAVKLAGTLCANEESATKAVRKYLGITSRKELMSNEEARRRLLALRGDFAASWQR